MRNFEDKVIKVISKLSVMVAPCSQKQTKISLSTYPLSSFSTV